MLSGTVLSKVLNEKHFCQDTLHLVHVSLGEGADLYRLFL